MRLLTEVGHVEYSANNPYWVPSGNDPTWFPEWTNGVPFEELKDWGKIENEMALAQAEFEHKRQLDFMSLGETRRKNDADIHGLLNVCKPKGFTSHDVVAVVRRTLGPKAASMIVAEASYEPSAPTISSQIAQLKASGADVLFGVVLGKFTSQLIKGVAELNWKPELFFVPTSASSISFLEPAGLENAVGLISSSNAKDTVDPQWADDAGVKEFFAFMKQWMPTADLNNSNYSAGYAYAYLLTKVLTACKDDFSRENIMRQAASLRNLELPLLLPGITVTTGPDDYLPFQQLRLRRFNGKNWIGFGDIIDDRHD